MIGIIELLLLGAALLLVVRLSKSGKITVHNEKFNRFADRVDEKAGSVLWHGPNAKRNSMIAAIILAVLIVAYPTNFHFVMRLIVAALVILAVKHWSRSAPTIADEEAPYHPTEPQRSPQEDLSPHAEVPSPPRQGTPRQFSRPIPPLRRLKQPAAAPAPNTEGFFSVILPAFGILCLIIGGGFALLVASGELSPRVYSQRDRTGSNDSPRDQLVTLQEGKPGPWQESNVLKNTTAPIEGKGIIGPEDRIEFLIDRPKVTFVSTLHSTLGEAREEIDRRVAEYLRAALAFEYAAKGIADWSPSPEWIRENLIVSENKVPHEEDVAGYFRLKSVASFAPEQLELASGRFQQDQMKDRTWLLAKTYAGTVSMLGGLAIVLRLGTGVRPGRGIGADAAYRERGLA